MQLNTKQFKHWARKNIFHSHDFQLIRIIAPGIKEVKCKICGKEYGVYDGISSNLPLDKDLRRAHAALLKTKSL